MRRALVLLLLVTLVGPACSGQADSDELKAARAQFKQKRYAATLRDLSLQLAAPRVSEEALILGLRAALRAKETRRARELARRLLSRPMTSADGLYYAGVVESSSGAYEQALALYKQARAKDPRHQGARQETVRALCQLGRAAMRKKDLAAARRLMARAQRVDPKADVVERNLALIELHAGRPHKAVEPLRRVLSRNPEDPVANRLMGRARAALGELKLAERHLEQAVATGHALGPVDHARTLMISGVVRARLGKLYNAMVDLTQAANVLGHAHPKLLAQVHARVARVRAALGIEQLGQGKQQAAWHSLRGALAACYDLPPTDRAAIQRAVLVGVAVRGRGKGKRLLSGLKVAPGPVLQADYAPIAAELIGAYADYFALDAGRRQKAAESFEQLADKVAAPARDKLLAMAVHSRLRAAALLYDKGAIAEAHKVHHQALKEAKAPPPAWRHNAAVLDYASGDRELAVAALGRLTPDVPLAVCNLAVHRELAYVPQEAYRLFKQCKARGGRFPGLQQILDGKRSVFAQGAER
jgi:tetratricopeptide (TPR) repeat protein